IPQGIKRLERCIARVEAWDPSANDIETVKSEANELETVVDAALTQAFGAGTDEFRRYSDARNFSYRLTMGQPTPDLTVRDDLRKCRLRSLGLLRAALTFLTDEQEFPTATPVPEDKPSVGSVVIGHGRSSEWLKLKDFLKDRLHLPVDEFNSVPVAGFTTVARLTEMLKNAAMAFLVMTA